MYENLYVSLSISVSYAFSLPFFLLFALSYSCFFILFCYHYLYVCFFFHESIEIWKEGDVGQLTGVGGGKTIFRILSEKIFDNRKKEQLGI